MRETSRFFSWCSCTGGGAVVASLAFGATLVASAPAQAECCTCLGDIDNNGIVDGADLGLLLGAWDGPGTPENEFCEDVNFDGVVDGADLGLLLGAWDGCFAFAPDTCGHPCAGPCDVAHDTPFCSDAKCCELVCAQDDFCCSVEWDSLCVAAAATICGGGDVCPNPDHDCCTTGTPGCSDEECCELVCSLDSFCCNVAWDAFCVGPNLSVPGASAIEACGLECPGPECPASDHDCFTTGGPGCTDAECCSTVCAIDSFCCAVAWDGICVGEALSFCGAPVCPFECTGTPEGEACGADTNGGCNPSTGGSTCCFASGGLGCDDAGCTSAVCAVDSFCCQVAWDSICAGEAATLCGDLCAPSGDTFGEISCGETICGTAWADGNFRDTDWYEITFAAPTEIIFSGTTTLPLVIGIVDTNGIPDCGAATALNPFAVLPLCGEGSFGACLPAGTYWFFAAPNAFAGFPCDSGNNEYSITLECVGPCDPPSCGDAGHDCFTTGGPFCDDASCCSIVCSADPFCCDVAWDSTCVNEATLLCLGQCPPSDHDCFTTGGPACSDNECCVAVCSVDSFCCLVAWDGICVNEAFSLCGAPECPFECTGTPEGEDCGADTNGGCNPSTGGSTCCFASGGIGCDDAGCQSAVCSVDSFCCAVAWDSICAGEAASLCGDLCAASGDTFGDISCGETICGTAWADGNFRDTDWYEITFDTTTEVTFSGSTTLPLVIGIVDTGGIPDCGAATALDPFAVLGFCSTGSFTACLPAGTYWFFAAPNGFAGFPCGTVNDYSVTLTCAGECEAPQICGNPEHDCCTTGTPGCSDVACCELVCSLDSFCCNVAWDAFCVGPNLSVPGASAIEACGADCGGGGGSCPFAPPEISEDCCAIVCAADAFCCDVAWDSICAGEAATLCP